MASGKRHLSWWQESLLLVAVALVLAIILKTYFVQAFYIPSPSMVPGLVKNDRILVEKPSYWLGSPQRGDVVVFEDPDGWLGPQDEKGPDNPVAKVLTKIGLYPSGGHLVKRVIGVGGDTIRCCDRRGRLMVNGHPLDEDAYVHRSDSVACRGPKGPGGAGRCSWTAGPVPEGDLFVMGDNRTDSADSSYHLCEPSDRACTSDDAYVPEGLVVGRVFAVIWPPEHVAWLHRPETFEDVPDPEE